MLPSIARGGSRSISHPFFAPVQAASKSSGAPSVPGGIGPSYALEMSCKSRKHRGITRSVIYFIYFIYFIIYLILGIKTYLTNSLMSSRSLK